MLSINEQQFDRFAAKIKEVATEDGHVALHGLTFKAGTDDLRHSPAIEVLQRLEQSGTKVVAYDPVADDATLRAMYQEVKAEMRSDMYSAIEGASVIAVLTEWPEFAELDFDKIGEIANGKVIVDARNVIDSSIAQRRGFTYRGIAS